MAYMHLGELLLSAGIITRSDLERGIALQKGTKDRLGTVLINNGIITEKELIEVLRMQLGIEFIDLTKVSIPTELAQVLPKNIARQYNVVPVRIAKDELYLAMSDPLNFYAVEEARRAAKRKIVPLVSTHDGIEHAIQILYSSEGAAKAIAEMKREAATNGDAQEAPDNNFATTQLGEDALSSAPTIRLVNSILERAITERASDIHLEPRESLMQVCMRIDGLMRDILTVPKDIQSSVISRIKIMSGLNIAEHRIPQDGRFNVRIKDKDIDLRVSTLPTVYGEKIVARLLDKSGGSVTKEAVGLTGSDLEKYDEMLKNRNGVILLVGPTGSGKTTTMYAMINQLNTPDVNMVTLEDPVEYNIDGINQVQINEKTGMTFASGLRAILRQIRTSLPWARSATARPRPSRCAPPSRAMSCSRLSTPTTPSAPSTVCATSASSPTSLRARLRASSPSALCGASARTAVRATRPRRSWRISALRWSRDLSSAAAPAVPTATTRATAGARRCSRCCPSPARCARLFTSSAGATPSRRSSSVPRTASCRCGKTRCG